MDLKKMLGKKDSNPDPAKVDAKKKALQTMKTTMAELMGEDMKSSFMPKKQVTVAADSEEGLKEGLEKAEELMEGAESLDEEEAPEKEDSELTLEDVERMEKELAEMKQKLMRG